MEESPPGRQYSYKEQTVCHHLGPIFFFPWRRQIRHGNMLVLSVSLITKQTIQRNRVLSRPHRHGELALAIHGHLALHFSEDRIVLVNSHKSHHPKPPLLPRTAVGICGWTPFRLWCWYLTLLNRLRRHRKIGGKMQQIDTGDNCTPPRPPKCFYQAIWETGSSFCLDIPFPKVFPVSCSFGRSEAIWRMVHPRTEQINQKNAWKFCKNDKEWLFILKMMMLRG